MRTERSALHGRVSRWRVRWVDGGGEERSKSFQRKPDAQTYLNGLTADVQRGEYVDPRKSAETFGSVAEQWFVTKQHRKPKTVAGYRSLLDTVVLPTWADVSLKRIDYESYSTWLGGLSVDGSQRGTALSASRITQAHQLVGAVLKYAQRTGRVVKNVALEIKRDEDLPEQAERERRYLNHAELLMLARATDRFEALTLVLGYCGLRFGEAVCTETPACGGASADGEIVRNRGHRKGHRGVDDQDEAGPSRASSRTCVEAASSRLTHRSECAGVPEP